MTNMVNVISKVAFHMTVEPGRIDEETKKRIPPVVDIVKAGDEFEMEEGDELDALIASGIVALAAPPAEKPAARKTTAKK